MTLENLSKIPFAGTLLRKIYQVARDASARRKASRQAVGGQDLAHQASLDYLVSVELSKLSEKTDLPLGVQSHEYKQWLNFGGNLEHFVTLLIARSANQPEVSTESIEHLASEYARITGESRKLATGPIDYTISYVYGQLRATSSGKQALGLALTQRTAASLFGIARHQLPHALTASEVGRVRSMACALLEAGKRSWKMPKFIAPLTLEANEIDEKEKQRPTNAPELAASISAGINLVLSGNGGIGKTTFLLDLCTVCLDLTTRIPVFVDASVWAQSNLSVLEYLAQTPAAQANRVTLQHLINLAEGGGLVVMVNGWNEIPAKSKSRCRELLIQLQAATNALNIVAVTRATSDAPVFTNAKLVEVKGLTWPGQVAVIRAELESGAVESLIQLLARNTRLRHAARSPLILRGLVAQAKRGMLSGDSVFDLLGSAVQAFEESDQRNVVLSGAPMEAQQRLYLEEIACHLTHQISTSCSRDEAFIAINTVAAQLTERNIIGSPLPSPSAVLEILASHHLLHLSDGNVRFVHHRFQEYFAATRLLQECISDAESSTFLQQVINQPSWVEALALISGKLKGDSPRAHARAKLVKTAATVDLGVACRLCGLCGFSVRDDPNLHDQLVHRVNAFAEASVEEVRKLGLAYQTSSGLPVFAAGLWRVLENEDEEIRQQALQLCGPVLSISQLGNDAPDRIKAWPLGRRLEFVRHIVDNADNYDFLVRLAREEQDAAVKVEAISALLWSFPASDVPLQIWLEAPYDVQVNPSLLNEVLYVVEESNANSAVIAHLKTLAAGDLDPGYQIRLATLFQGNFSASTLDAIFEQLSNVNPREDIRSQLEIAQEQAPERVLNLAKDLVLHRRATPGWVGDYLRDRSAEVQSEIFEEVWTALHGDSVQQLSYEDVGTLANSGQIERAISSWLNLAMTNYQALPALGSERRRFLGQMLSHVNGENLLQSVLQRAPNATYKESEQLVDLVRMRIYREDGVPNSTAPWLPTIEQVAKLIAAYDEKVESAIPPQDSVRIYLCGIASHVAPAHFGGLLLDTCRRHLDSWAVFREQIAQWSNNRGAAERPRNPSLGNYLAAAFIKWGPDALPGLLTMVTHPSALDFIPNAIARVVQLPWASLQKRDIESLNNDIREGASRREKGRSLKQPDESFQKWTDDSAIALGQKLNELLASYQEKQSTGREWNSREAEYQVGSLANVVANIPSAEIVGPVNSALASGLMDLFKTVGVLRGLLRQGIYISSTEVITQLEALHKRMEGEQWLDQHAQYSASEFTELLLIMVPPHLRSKSVEYYLERWRKFSYPEDIARRLGTSRSDVGWDALLVIARDAENGRPPQDFVSLLVSTLTPSRLNEFVNLIGDGTFLSWCADTWMIGRIAPGIASVIADAGGNVNGFIAACHGAHSYLADALANEVLMHLKLREGERQTYLLGALDAGRASSSNTPAFNAIVTMFTRKIESDDSYYEVAPIALNEFRKQIYIRAKNCGNVSADCRRILAELECLRIESGRPDDEPRHPMLGDGTAWTDVFVN